MAYASSLTMANGTLGTAQSFTITSESSAYLHTLTVATTDGTYSTTILSKSTSKSGSWSPSLSWSASNTTGETIIAKATLTTYTASGETIGTSTKTVLYAIPESVVPTVSLSVSDATGYAGTYGKYIKGKSKVKAVISASGIYGSTIKSYRATFDGRTYTSSSFTTNLISSSGTLTFSVSVTDTRGRRATTSISVSVADYDIPSITALTVARCADADGNGTSGEFLKVTFSSDIFALDNLNTATYSLKYKKTTDTEYTTETLTDFSGQYSVASGVFVFSADSDASYNVTLTVTDALSSGTKTAIGASASKFFSIFGKGLGLALGKIAELAGVFDIAFQTRHSGGLLHPVLEDNTDLDDVTIPNTYAGKNASTAGYLNCPVSNMTFTLRVEEAGNEGQLRQTFTTCSKAASRTFERFYYQSAWGDWICTSDIGGKLLWSGVYYMASTQTVTLAEAISKQAHGIVLCWSWYDTSSSEAVNSEFRYMFIPKYHISAFSGKSVVLSDYYAEVKKTVYISDEQISGYTTNNTSGTDTVSGFEYNNTRIVLRAVIGL